MNTDKNRLRSLLDKINSLGSKMCSDENMPQIEVDILKDKLREMYSLLMDYEEKIPQDHYMTSPSEMPQIESQEEISQDDILPQQTVIFEQSEDDSPKEIEVSEPQKDIPNNLEEEALPSVEDELPIDGEEFDFYSEEEIAEANDTHLESELKQEKEPYGETEINNIIENTPSVLNYLRNSLMDEIDNELKTPSAFDLFSQQQTTVADKFADTQTINDKVGGRNFGDLRTNIGVNDKFLFINNLFEGNMKKYTDFIQELNASEDKGNALLIIDRYKQENQWSETSLAFTTLLDIIEKRFRKRT
ncbi:MAG: hypothetical protein LBL74_00665 [Bacteroidales bacterium]|jgi:hypothetical protein|nr:hypothetical protein [Bacteroidales bacterium]